MTDLGSVGALELLEVDLRESTSVSGGGARVEKGETHLFELSSSADLAGESELLLSKGELFLLVG
jgi:hypothetical protein